MIWMLNGTSKSKKRFSNVYFYLQGVIKLERVNGSKLRFAGQITKFKKVNSNFFFAKNARFFEYYVHILA